MKSMILEVKTQFIIQTTYNIYEFLRRKKRQKTIIYNAYYYYYYLDTDLTERWQEIERQYLNTGDTTLTNFHFFVKHAPPYVVLSYIRIKDSTIKINMEYQLYLLLNAPYHKYVSFKILALLPLLFLLRLLLLAPFQRTN